MKFKSDIEIQAGVEAGGSTGSSGQVLSSTGSGVAWIDQSAITSASDFVFFNVKNETGSTILKGKGVMAVGTDGNSGHILVDEMVADGTVEPKYFLGVLEEDIVNGAFARVISFGQLSQFNTTGQNGETWADGQILWCDPANPGDFTITEPDGPNVKIAAAFILNSSTNGKIQVRVQANEGIHDLHDTKITSQVDGDVLVWDNTTGVWFNDSTLNVDYTNGNVGIGTTSPSYKLDVAGNIRVDSTSVAQIFLDSAASSDSVLNFHENASQKGKIGYDASLGGIALVAGSGSFSTADMVLLDGGNVGIGTTSPSAKLHVNGDIIVGGDGTDAILRFWETTNGWTIRHVAAGNRLAMSNILGGTDHFNILENGNVGIGTTIPSSPLHIDGGANNEVLKIEANSDPFIRWVENGTDVGFLQFQGGSAYLSNISNGSFFFRTNNTDKMVITSTGNVGIGTTSPSYKLDVTGEGRFTGDVRGLSFITTSQRDQKEGITDIIKTKAKTIPFKEYTYKSSIDSSARKRYGVVAEDIENDYPELVYTGEDGIKGVNYIDLLVKRVAELEKELEDATGGFTGTQTIVTSSKGSTAVMTYVNGLLKNIK